MLCFQIDCNSPVVLLSLLQVLLWDLSVPVLLLLNNLQEDIGKCGSRRCITFEVSHYSFVSASHIFISSSAQSCCQLSLLLRRSLELHNRDLGFISRGGFAFRHLFCFSVGFSPAYIFQGFFFDLSISAPVFLGLGLNFLSPS